MPVVELGDDSDYATKLNEAGARLVVVVNLYFYI